MTVVVHQSRPSSWSDKLERYADVLLALHRSTELPVKAFTTPGTLLTPP